MNTPLISIIVPIYNVERYLRKCVDSILGQTYANIELILVDDGSPDGCPAICDEYAAKDRRVVVIHQQNAGVSAARNAGLDAAKGEYIGFVDSDDWIESDFIEVLYEVIQRSGADIASSSYCETESVAAKITPDQYIGFTSHELITKMLHDHWETLFVWGKLFAGKLIAGLRFTSAFANAEDGVFVIKAIVKSRKIAFVDYRSYHYIFRGDSAAHAFKESFWTMLDAVDVILDAIKDFDGNLGKSVVQCAIKKDILLAKAAEAKGKFSKEAYKKLLAHIKKYIHKDSWNLLSHRAQCWLALLLCGRIPFIAGCKIWKKLRRLKAAL